LLGIATFCESVLISLIVQSAPTSDVALASFLTVGKSPQLLTKVLTSFRHVCWSDSLRLENQG
jgi:hypothetical protein